jgi:hypothetical protein
MSKIKIKNLPIYGFMHCCAVNNYKEIISEQVNKIIMSGLYCRCKNIEIGVLGEYDKEFWITLPEKFNIGYRSHNIKEYEFPTLKLLYDKCMKEDCLVWYIHTKGVVYKENYGRGGQVKWRRDMEGFVIKGWRQCIRTLECNLFNTCGPFLSRVNGWHYAGNFWWSKSSYIKEKKSPIHINTNRWNAEKWLLGYDNVRNIPTNIRL